MEDDTKKRLQSLFEEIDRRHDMAEVAVLEAQRTADAWRGARIFRVCADEDSTHRDLEWNLSKLKDLGLISQDEYDEATTLRRRIYRRALGLPDGE